MSTEEELKACRMEWHRTELYKIYPAIYAMLGAAENELTTLRAEVERLKAYNDELLSSSCLKQCHDKIDELVKERDFLTAHNQELKDVVEFVLAGLKQIRKNNQGGYIGDSVIREECIGKIEALPFTTTTTTTTTTNYIAKLDVKVLVDALNCCATPMKSHPQETCQCQSCIACRALTHARKPGLCD